MIKLLNDGQFLINADTLSKEAALSKEEAKKNTLAYRILESHNTSGNMDKLKIKFDAMASHDITYVGIIQTARASGLNEFSLPYVLTNCHNSLCAVGGTINEDDHVFGLSAAVKYGGIYVPAHQAVIHQYIREMMAGSGKMILGSDSHTRYGALGTMAIGEGGPELVKQLLNKTYDIDMPDVVAIYLEGDVKPGVGPQDVALAIIGAVFKNGFVKNSVMEFVGPGVKNLPIEFRIGIDVMTTETTCLSSIWVTDDKTEEYFEKRGRKQDYKELVPGDVAYYDRVVKVDLSKVKPMIAMPFHPSNVYTVEDVVNNPYDILKKVEDEAKVQLEGTNVDFKLTDKIIDGKVKVEQGIIAGCAGGTFDNLCAAADILKGKSIGNGEFAMSVYPASQPVFIGLTQNDVITQLMLSGVTVKTAFCGPCFGAGDVPANNGLSIRHSTRNFPNREGSKPSGGQIASVALMDARSIAATAANKGFLTAATDLDVEYNVPEFNFDDTVYKNRVYNGFGNAKPEEQLKFGPNIADWPQMSELTDNLLLKVACVINDPVTTTDELIPSGETSSYRSNPLKLAEFTLSRKAPDYVESAKAVQVAEKARLSGKCPIDAYTELEEVFKKAEKYAQNIKNTGIGSLVYAVKPGDGSAREQAASCQKVLGGWANIAKEYATKRYRSNLINWGMLPFIIKQEVNFEKDDYIFIPDIKNAVKNKISDINAYVIGKDVKELKLELSNLTDDERQIILSGCLINYYKDTK
ncbi:MAG: hydratase [Clostridia bacterium]|nr:hydratase [Clostridia bacterium]